MSLAETMVSCGRERSHLKKNGWHVQGKMIPPAIFGNNLGELCTHRNLMESCRAVPRDLRSGIQQPQEKSLTPCVSKHSHATSPWKHGCWGLPLSGKGTLSLEWNTCLKINHLHPVRDSRRPLGRPSVFLLYFLLPGSPPRHLHVSCLQRDSSWVALFEVSFLKQTDSKKVIRACH